MKKEQELILLLNRLHFDERTLERIEHLLMTDINWFELFKLAFYHKNVTLCWSNLQKHFPEILLPKYLDDAIRCIYYGFKKRNEAYQKEIKSLISMLNEQGIKVIPVKGSMLIPDIYKDYGIRYSGDADFLIRYRDIENLDRVLTNDMGYTKGNYSVNRGCIEPVSRMEEIKWKVYMSNLFPYCKLVEENDLPLKYVKLDFRFALDDTRCYDTVDEIVGFYENSGYVNPIHILTHLCTHFYNEAKYIIALKRYKDLNLIKLCDIREYIYNYFAKKELSDFTDFVKKHGLEKAVYYTFYWLRLVYEDGYEREVLDSLEVDNLDFLTTFGNNTITDQKKFHKSELERLFSCDNVDELK